MIPFIYNSISENLPLYLQPTLIFILLFIYLLGFKMMASGIVGSRVEHKQI